MKTKTTGEGAEGARERFFLTASDGTTYPTRGRRLRFFPPIGSGNDEPREEIFVPWNFPLTAMASKGGKVYCLRIIARPGPGVLTSDPRILFGPLRPPGKVLCGEPQYFEVQNPAPWMVPIL